jgi:hypothetical protein
MVAILMTMSVLMISCESKPMTIEFSKGELGALLKGNNNDAVFISPAKVYVNNIRRGDNITYNMKIRNDTKYDNSFTIKVIDPDRQSDGYSSVPMDWVEYPDVVTVEKRTSYEFPIIVTIPEKAQSDKYEFWLSISNTKSSGLIKVELCSKCIIGVSNAW